MWLFFWWYPVRKPNTSLPISLHHQERFFLDARQAFGRTALVLTGGMTLGLFHMGVVKCLYEQGCLPPVICGTSIGVGHHPPSTCGMIDMLLFALVMPNLYTLFTTQVIFL